MFDDTGGYLDLLFKSVLFQWIGLRENLQETDIEWESLWFPVSIFP